MANYGNIEDLLSGNIQRLQQQPVGINALNQSMQNFGDAFSAQINQQKEAQRALDLAFKKAEIEHKYALKLEEQKLKNKKEIGMWSLKTYKDYLNQSQENSSPEQSSAQSQMWQPPQQGPMMSYAGGGEGPAIARQPVDTSMIQNGNPLNQGGDTSPFIPIPDGDGGIKIVQNPLFLSPREKIQQDLQEKRMKQLTILNTQRLRQEFINRPEVKDFMTIKQNVKIMDNLSKQIASGNMKNAVGIDQALITLFNKLSDPQSVVRESEYGRTPGNLPVVNAMVGAIEKIQKGGAGLTDKDRRALVEAAQIIANQRGAQFNDTMQQYNDIAVAQELEPSLVTRGMPSYQMSGQGQGDNQKFSPEEIQAELKRRGL